MDLLRNSGRLGGSGWALAADVARWYFAAAEDSSAEDSGESVGGGHVSRSSRYDGICDVYCLGGPFLIAIWVPFAGLGDDRAPAAEGDAVAPAVRVAGEEVRMGDAVSDVCLLRISIGFVAGAGTATGAVVGCATSM